MSDQDIRIPKGILKNKYGSSSRESLSSSTSYGASDVSLGWNQPGMLSGPHGGMMPVAPVPAPNHGMNMPNPVLDPVLRGIGSGFPSPMHQKLSEFMSNKRELLFRPLDADETPMSEVKGTQRNTEDHYGIVPSFDHFLRVDNSEIRRYFFQNAAVGDIVIGKVVSRSSSGLYMHLLCTEGGKHIILEDLNVRAYCPAHLTIPIDSRDANRFYDEDDIVRLEILEIVMESDRLIAGMKGSSLSAEMQHSFQLGFISRRDLPKYYVLSKYKDSSDPRVRRTYQELLHESPGFQNPNSTSHLAANMGIFNISNSLMKGIRLGCPSHENASQLRRLQNARWAHGHVAEGRKYFKLGKFTEAFQSLNSALNIDRENVEALVTRGALYASKENYEKAIDDFESALKFNPNNLNAKKYLAETLVALGRQQEGSGKLEDAIASYSKSLVVWPDHKEAKEALWSLHARTEKLDPAKLTGPAAAKAVELKAKLKTILQSELGMKVEQKTPKEKRSKKDKKKRDSSASDDSSSSSSSDDSSSDSSSSGSGYKKRSKKRRKKKSKKSKKSRRESASDKRQKEPSLSPFSKRLADTGSGGIPTSGFSGFTDSTYAELQLGISKHDRSKNDSNGDDGKRSSKKSKEKKRSKKSKDKKRKKKRGASSDSSSTDSESERSKKKSKKPSDDAPLAILPDLGDLEAKLSAYYSKIEQGKMETKFPTTHRSRSRSRSRSRGRERERRSRSKSPLIMKRSSMDYDIVPPRTIENVPPPRIEQPYRTDIMPSWSDRMPGKIDLQTDEYGNMLEAKAIICTVKNDISMSEEEPLKPSKFEMKFKPMSMSGDLTNKDENGANAASATGDVGSKWRPLGAAMAFPQSEAIRNAFGKASSPLSDNDSRRTGDKVKRYRRTSRSHSRSPRNRKRRSRSFSRSRSGSRSYSRSRSRSRSPSYRRRGYQGGYRSGRGRAPVRFFRGYNYPRGGGGGRRPYTSRSFGHDNRDRDRDYGGGGGGGGGGRSKFRNRFSHTPSRSRSRSRDRRSRSRSISPHNRRRERSVDKGVKSPPHQRNDHPSTSKMEADSLSQSQDDIKMVDNNEIHLGKLKASGSTTDLEILLDKRNAEKKEEMRKSNPEFFRAT